MRSQTKKVLLGGTIAVAVVAMAYARLITRKRDCSSPEITIQLVDGNGAPQSGIEVERNWYDSDRGKDGYEKTNTDSSGIAVFPKISARVGIFTGAGRKALGFLSPCGPGSGTSTTVYVRYNGLANVLPKGKPLHPSGQSQRDSDGFWFWSSLDRQSNTLVNLSFLDLTTNITYVLASSRIHDAPTNFAPIK